MALDSVTSKAALLKMRIRQCCQCPPPSLFIRNLTAIYHATSTASRAVQFVPSRFSPGRDQARLPLSRPTTDARIGTAPDPKSITQKKQLP